MRESELKEIIRGFRELDTKVSRHIEHFKYYVINDTKNKKLHTKTLKTLKKVYIDIHKIKTQWEKLSN